VSSHSVASGLEKFRSAWKPYVLQSVVAGLTTFMILLFLTLEHAVIIAALGASAFIVFGRPFDITARPQNLIGGHLVGFAVGSLCAALPHLTTGSALACYALSVGLSIFIMSILNMQHPPAAGTALGMSIRGCSEEAFAAVLTITLVLAIVHFVLKPRLRNLF